MEENFEDSDCRRLDYRRRIALHAIRGRPRDNLSAPSHRSATSFSVTGRRTSYSFRGERGEYCCGDCVYVGLVQPLQLATVVFYNVHEPELNKIAMGLLFYRLTILGRGVTDLDKQTLVAQPALAETTS